MTAGGTATRRPTGRALRQSIPALRPVWWGAGFALVGTEAFEVVVLMLTTAAYGSILSVGALGVALRLAPMVVGPLLVAALDRQPTQRARFARASVLARAVALAVFATLVMTDSTSAWLTYPVVALVAALDSVYLSATRATLPRIIGDRPDGSQALVGANSMLVVQWNTVQVLVPPVAVWFLSFTTAPLTIAASVGLLLAAFVILGDYVHRASGALPSASGSYSGATFTRRLTSGFVAIRHDAVARALVVTAAAGQGAVFAFSLALPTVSVDGATTLPVGVALSAMAVGSILGARWAGSFDTQRTQIRALFGATCVLAASFAAAAAAPSFLVMVAIAFAVGAAAGVAAVPRSTLLQSRFDEARLGAVAIAGMVLGQVLMPILPALWDAVRNARGVSYAFVMLAALQIVALVAAAATLRSPRRRDPGAEVTT